MPPFLPRIFSHVRKYHANTLDTDAATAALGSHQCIYNKDALPF